MLSGDSVIKYCQIHVKENFLIRRQGHEDRYWISLVADAQRRSAAQLVIPLSLYGQTQQTTNSLYIFFFYFFFLRKYNLTLRAKCLLKTICTKRLILYSEKYTNNTLECRLLKCLLIMFGDKGAGDIWKLRTIFSRETHFVSSCCIPEHLDWLQSAVTKYLFL